MQNIVMGKMRQVYTLARKGKDANHSNNGTGQDELQLLTDVETFFKSFMIKPQLTVLWSDDSNK